MMTQRQKLRRAFFSGQELTSKQIKARYGIASPSKVVSMLRLEDGFLFTQTPTQIPKDALLRNFAWALQVVK